MKSENRIYDAVITGAGQAENPLAQNPAERNFRNSIKGRLCCYDLRDDIFTCTSSAENLNTLFRTFSK